MSYADEINEIRQSVELGPYQFELTLTFTEIDWIRCSLLSKEISQKFVEILLIPTVLKSFSINQENVKYSVCPFISKRKSDTHWLYNYHLFVTKESEVQQPCPDQTISRNQAEVERENLDEHCDDFDLTISSSLEDKIDKNFWSTRLNFSLKFADSYSVSSKVSQLQKLCTTQSSINFKSDLKKDIADFEIFDSIADVYEDIGPPRTLENESTLNFTNDATLDLPLNVAVTENNSAEPSSMDQNINQSLNENTDSQETVCEQNDNEGRDTHSLVEEAKQNVENEDQGNINDTAGGNIQSVGEDSSQASSLYYETVPSPNQDNYMSLSDAEFQSPATSPVFAASQAYKDQIYHDLAGSLSFSLDPPSHSD